MEQTHRPRGLATLNFFAADHNAVKEWYTNLLGVSPYFERPGYVEFRIGDYQHELELLMPDMHLRKPIKYPKELLPIGTLTTWRERWKGFYY